MFLFPFIIITYIPDNFIILPRFFPFTPSGGVFPLLPFRFMYQKRFGLCTVPAALFYGFLMPFYPFFCRIVDNLLITGCGKLVNKLWNNTVFAPVTPGKAFQSVYLALFLLTPYKVWTFFPFPQQYPFRLMYPKRFDLCFSTI